MTIDALKLPTFVTPENLPEFAGGREYLRESGAHLTPGSERWRKYLIAQIQKEATGLISQWLTSQFDSFVSFFTMMHGPRPVNNDADAWDASFEDELYTALYPHFKAVFPEDETREKQVLNWLARNISDNTQPY